MATTDGMRMEISGLRELQKRAAKLEDRLARRSYSKAVRAASKPVVRNAISRAPGRTGTTKKSIKARSNNKPSKMLFGMKIGVVSGKFSSDRTARRRGSGNVYRPDEAIRYYRFQELGTKFHPAQPFLEPALESSASDFFNVLRREMAAELETQSKSL